MYSLARVKTSLKHGGQAKVTLEASAPGLFGKHSKAILQVSGPSTSKVTVSAKGAPNKKHKRQGGARAGNDKEATTSTLLLKGPGP
jgi:hypothetical protein